MLKSFALSTQIKNETCTPVTPSVNDCVSDALLIKCCSAKCSKMFQWRLTMLAVGLYSKILNKLKINLLNRNTSQFIVLTSLICALIWLMCMNNCAVEHSNFSIVECDDTFQVKWYIPYHLFLQCILEYNRERIIEIYPQLREL